MLIYLSKIIIYNSDQSQCFPLKLHEKLADLVKKINMYTNGTVNHVRTLWLWDTLPKKGLNEKDQTWLNKGDAVENVHRLKLGKNSKLWQHVNKYSVYLIFRDKT